MTQAPGRSRTFWMFVVFALVGGAALRTCIGMLGAGVPTPGRPEYRPQDQLFWFVVGAGLGAALAAVVRRLGKRR